jgi:hypothetical protein
MGIDAVIVNHTKRKQIRLAGRLHSYYCSPGPNFVCWLTTPRSAGGHWGKGDGDWKNPRGSWEGDEIEIAGDTDDAEWKHGAWPPTGDPVKDEPYEDATRGPEMAAWLKLWKDDPNDSDVDRNFCRWMRGITIHELGELGWPEE